MSDMNEMPDFSLFDIQDKPEARKQLCGWKEDLHKEAWEKIKHLFSPFKIDGDTKVKKKTMYSGAGRKRMLYEIVKKVLGKYTPNYAQSIGDCTSFGAKNVNEYLSCTQILLENKAEGFRPIFPPYFYGVGRVIIGKEYGTDFACSEDGGIGSYVSEGVTKYGALFADEDGVPKYSGQVAKSWGCDGPPNNFVSIAKRHLIKSAARITNWDDFVNAIVNGYPIHFCSNLSFQMQPNSNGFHEQTSEGWPHCMGFIGVDDEWKDPYAILLNSWGEDAHGILKDFYTGETLPGGCLRVHKSVIEKALRDQDVEAFAWSQYDGFPAKRDEIDFKLFDLYGN
jgi:hypothetical protein